MPNNNAKLTFTTRIKTIGIQGRPGRPGLDGIASQQNGTIYRAIADTSISGHRAVIRTASGISYASNDNLSHKLATIGVTLNAANVGDMVTVIVYGEITEPSWNWTPNLPVFLGVNGNLVQVAPNQVNSFSLIIGFAISPQILLVSLKEAITTLGG